MTEHTAHRTGHCWCPVPVTSAGRRLPARLRQRRPLTVPPSPPTAAPA